MLRIYFLSLLLWLTYYTAFSQHTDESNTFLFLKFDYSYGNIFETVGFFQGKNKVGTPVNRINSYLFELGWQTKGNGTYDAVMKYPSYGIGFSSFTFPQTEELGDPHAIYAFVDGAIHRRGNFALKYVIRLGLSYNWNASDPVKNPYNLVIGSYKNAYVSFGLAAEYNLGRHLDIGAGISSAHISNGKSTEPNSGVNHWGPNVYARYHFNKGQKPDYRKLPVPKFNPVTELFISFGIGTHQERFGTHETGAPQRIAVNYPVYNISTAMQRHFAWSGKIGGGIDLVYNGSVNAAVEPTHGGIWQKTKVPFKEKFQVGIFASYEWVMGNASIYFRPGYRIIRDPGYRDEYPDFYQHVAFKYHLDRFVFGMGLRATKFSFAEYLEWNIGYRITWP